MLKWRSLLSSDTRVVSHPLMRISVIAVGRLRPPFQDDVEHYRRLLGGQARVDHEVDEEEIPGVVVSRVNLSPRFMRELIDAMEDNYSKWRTREGIKNLPEFEGEEEDSSEG